ncbi:phage protein [Spirochaetia bacterium]|nr:phage protein [Spirochaetia bacterium]
MREIIFRGKRKDTGEWIYGDLFHHAYGIDNGEYISIAGHTNVNPFNYDVQLETIGQYTGFKDRNNKMIFEGDIVDVLDPNFEKVGRGEIELLDEWGLWYVDSVPSFQEDLEHGKCNQANNGLGDILYENYVEIIGNIHDNHELLKEKHPA